MEYTVKQLADLTGVSARTLRYYDQIGLLKPARVSEAGYRIYGPGEAEILQQILFYRERGLALEQISEILHREDFDVMEALEDHLRELLKSQKRIEKLILTVEKTIRSMRGEIQMSDQERFHAFRKELVGQNEEKYGKEIREKYGDSPMDGANRKLLGMTQEEYRAFKDLEQEILEALLEAVKDQKLPESEKGREIAKMHQKWIQKSWNSYSAKAHRGLVQTYTEDERFRGYYDGKREGCAEFLKKAVEYWIK